MPRSNTNAELWDALTEFGRFLDLSTGSSTMTVTAVAAEGATTFTMAAQSSGLSTGEYIRVGPVGGAQICFVTATSTADLITLRSGLAEAISTGEEIRRLERTNLGCPDDSGVAVDVTADIQTINCSVQREAFAHLVTHTDSSVTVGILNVSFENVAATVGSPESDIGGANTAADPTFFYWKGNDFDTVKPAHYYAKGTLKDGAVVEVQFWDCDIDPSKSFALGRGQEVTLGLTFFPRIIAWFRPLA